MIKPVVSDASILLLWCLCRLLGTVVGTPIRAVIQLDTVTHYVGHDVSLLWAGCDTLDSGSVCSKRAREEEFVTL
jgi:hypothetical protein